MRFVVVGDMHVVPSELEDCDAVIDLANKAMFDYEADVFVFTGDQTHTNAVLRLEVQEWWRKRIQDLTNPVYFLVGNHDQLYPGALQNSMSVFSGTEVSVFDVPTDDGFILWVPYIHDPREFERICQAHAQTRIVFCHQAFNGAKYDNGFPILDGVDLDAIPQKVVVSGHIHARNMPTGRLGIPGGKLWYPGSPRWRTLADANTDKAIYVVDVDDGGVSVVAEISTEPCCRKIFHLEVKESEALPQLEFDPRHRYHVDVYGSQAWTKTVAEYLTKEFGAKTRTFPDTVTATVSEADGIDVALSKFLASFQAPNGTSSKRLLELVGGLSL